MQTHPHQPHAAHAQGHDASPGSHADIGQQGAPGAIYTCPMHPEIRQPAPGSCPKCGMTLEPVMPGLEEEANPELADFQRRFWWTLPLTVIVTLMAMLGHRTGWMDMATQSWVELVLTVPIVLWAGWPFFVRGVQSLRERSPNMWTLIGLGTAAAFLYSAVAAPGLRPARRWSRTRSGRVPCCECGPRP